MKFLKNLLGRKEPEGPRWNTKPPAQRPVPRRHTQVSATPPPTPAPAQKEKNPFLDDGFADMELLNDVSPIADDPYSTNSWKQAKDSDTRKLKTLHLGSQTVKKGSSDDFNPYDTGVFRRGWKD